MSVTIKRIADELHLSRNTVSKALNGRHVPEKTRQIIFEKAKEMNYKSFHITNGTQVEKKYRILLVSAKPLNNINFFISLISSIENYCFERNYEFFQYIFNTKKNDFNKFADYATELNVDGIIAIECFDKDFITKLLKLEIPVCFYDFAHQQFSFSQNFDVIFTNDEQSISDYVKLLHKKYNARYFTFVGDHRHCHSFRKRYTGMLIGLKNVKIHHSSNEDINLSEEQFNYGNPKDLKEQIYKLPQFPEVFICCNDFVARNVCIALKTMNIHVPSQALVIGFDNSVESYTLSPTITTFSTDNQFIGNELMRTLINRIENKQNPSRFITVSTDLIVRESSNKIKKEA